PAFAEPQPSQQPRAGAETPARTEPASGPGATSTASDPQPAPDPAPAAAADPAPAPPPRPAQDAPSPAPPAPPASVSPAELEPEDPPAYSRRGFYLSIGIGCAVGSSLFCSSAGSFNSYPAFATKFQIGVGVTDTIMIHWTSRVEWVTYTDSTFDPDTGSTTYDNELHPWGVGGIGITHFFSETPTSLYIGADIGYSNIMDFDRGENDFGFGTCAELGWEFAHHFSVEHALCLGTADDGTEYPAAAPFLASLTLNYISK
ncbi:MAG TPA: hypothetical protein VGK73_36850, partial [Polyangiaceae bacterium]